GIGMVKDFRKDGALAVSSKDAAHAVSDSKQITPAMKQTEIGLIPEDWEVKELGEVALLSKSKFNPNNSSRTFRCIELEHLESNSGRIIGETDTDKTVSAKNFFYNGNTL